VVRPTFVALTLLALVVPTTLAFALPPVPQVRGPSGPADVMGVWEAPFDGQAPAVNMVLLRDGKVLYWSGVEAGQNDGVFFTGTPVDAQSRVWDPATGIVSTPADPEGAAGDLFCSGQTILPDGRVLTAGGSDWQTLPGSALASADAAQQGQAQDPWPIVNGLKDARAFDPATGAWTRVADMGVGRWYPTVMELPDGSALAVSGIQNLTDPRTMDTLLETYSAGADLWHPVAGADHLLPMYPRLFVVPSGPLKGQLFYETDATLWGPFGERPEEGLWSLEQAYDPATNAWSYLGPSEFGARQHGATVMLPLDPSDGYTARLLTLGGTLQRSVVATPASEVTTLGPEGVTHAATGLLNHARWFPNGVLLPDGSVLAVGGGLIDNVVAHGQRSPPVMDAEQFDLATGQWQERASMDVPRTYHSTAILLPDGRVLSGGHVPLPMPWTAVRDDVPYEDQIAETRLQIYDPPYLFWGHRPVISEAPSRVGYGEPFKVETPNATEVQDVMLVHPGATTHAWDAAERAVVLPVERRDSDGVWVRAPPDADVAQPGDWMVFLRTHVEGKGDVPSVAAFTHLS